MKILLIIFFVSAVTGQLLPPTEDSVWHDFCITFPNVLDEVDISNAAALASAKYYVFTTYLAIKAHNLLYAVGFYIFELGQQASDWMSPSQFIKYRTGNTNPGHARKRSVPQDTIAPSPCDNLPASVDWSTKYRVSPIQDQKTCGCCYIFASVSCIESQEAIKYDTDPVKISEEQVLQCMKGSAGGCSGGDGSDVYGESKTQGGLVSASVYTSPYDGKDLQGCNEGTLKHARSTVDHYVYIPKNDENALKCAVAIYGPIDIALYGTSPDFKNFVGSGIFNDPNRQCGNYHNHEVVLVGYGTDSVNGDFWMIRNSWSTTWGNNGYGKIKRGSNLCAIASNPQYPVLTTFCQATVDITSGGTYSKTACIREIATTQSDAHTLCQKYDMGLYQITSSDNFLQLAAWLGSLGIAGGVGSSLWVDGKLFPDGNWYYTNNGGQTPAWSGLPWETSPGANSGCLEIFNSPSGWSIRGLDCSQQQWYVCEYVKVKH